MTQRQTCFVETIDLIADRKWGSYSGHFKLAHLPTCLFCHCSLNLFSTCTRPSFHDTGKYHVVFSFSLRPNRVLCVGCGKWYCRDCCPQDKKQCALCNTRTYHILQEKFIGSFSATNFFYEDSQGHSTSKPRSSPYVNQNGNYGQGISHADNHSTDKTKGGPFSTRLNLVEPNNFHIKETFSNQRDHLLDMCQYRRHDFSCDKSFASRKNVNTTNDKWSLENVTAKGLSECTLERRLLIASDCFDESCEKVISLNKTKSYGEQNQVRSKGSDQYKEGSYGGAKWFSLIDRDEIQSFLLSVPPFCRHFYVCPDPNLPVDLVMDIDKEIPFELRYSEYSSDIAFFSLLGTELSSLHYQFQSLLSKNDEVPHPLALYSLFKVFMAVEASFRMLFNDSIGMTVLLNGCRCKVFNKEKVYKISFHVHIRPKYRKNAVFANMNDLCQYINFLKGYPDELQSQVNQLLDEFLHSSELTKAGTEEAVKKFTSTRSIVSRSDLDCIDIAIYRPWQPIRLPYCSKRDDAKLLSIIEAPLPGDILRFYPPIHGRAPEKSTSEMESHRIFTYLFGQWIDQVNTLSEASCFQRSLVTRSIRPPMDLSENKSNSEILSLEKIEGCQPSFPYHPASSTKRRRVSASASVDVVPQEFSSDDIPHNEELVHPIQESHLVYTTSEPSDRVIAINQNSDLHALLTRLLIITHASFGKSSHKIIARLRIPRNSAPFIYIRQHISTYCLFLKRNHRSSYGQFKLYIRYESARAIAASQKVKTFEELGIIGLYFICWSNDCQGDSLYLGDPTQCL
ncbi:putative proteoin [Perkinsela sp. CCAP 1560/4]|nr:putative proteoin [Perkinsela sp. CCAP 1560/4]|eukprot:KNH09512.1 putative proteoin [Perkinsela sp. CCAP 1560/4]